MTTTTGKTTFTKTGNTTGCNFMTKCGNELLVVMRNETGAFANVTGPLARNNIHVECFTAYAWGNEVAFRFVTDNNNKAREIWTNAGYTVTESPVAIWYTDNNPTTLGKATTAMATACIDTYCSYMNAVPNTDCTVVTFNTSDTNKTINILNDIC
jgi:hypothetical protein